MRFKRIEDLKEYLVRQGLAGTVVLESPSYISAVVGISTDGRLIYSRDLMVRYLCKLDGMTELAAEEFIDLNTVGALSNMGEKAPVIMEGFV